MRKKTTQFQLDTFLPELVDQLPTVVGHQYKVTPRIYADLFIIKNKQYQHTLFYNDMEESKLVTEFRKEPLAIRIITLIVLGIWIAYEIYGFQLNCLAK